MVFLKILQILFYNYNFLISSKHHPTKTTDEGRRANSNSVNEGRVKNDPFLPRIKSPFRGLIAVLRNILLLLITTHILTVVKTTGKLTRNNKQKFHKIYVLTYLKDSIIFHSLFRLVFCLI